MEIGKASNLPGAGCPGLPGLNANSRPGAGCPGKPPHRYICEYIHLQWKSKVGGGLPRPQASRPGQAASFSYQWYVCAHIHRDDGDA